MASVSRGSKRNGIDVLATALTIEPLRLSGAGHRDAPVRQPATTTSVESGPGSADTGTPASAAVSRTTFAAATPCG
jgi:hypothetical protein